MQHVNKRQAMAALICILCEILCTAFGFHQPQAGLLWQRDGCLILQSSAWSFVEGQGCESEQMLNRVVNQRIPRILLAPAAHYAANVHLQIDMAQLRSLHMGHVMLCWGTMLQKKWSLDACLMPPFWARLTVDHNEC